MKVSTLGVVMPDGDTGAVCDVCRDAMHALGVKGCLELRGHEAIAITRVAETGEVDGEHGHVKGDRDSDETEDAGEQMLEPKTRSDVLGVAQQKPQLEGSQAPNPSNGEQTNPLHTDGSSKTQSGHSQPEPPIRRKRFRMSLLMDIEEGSPCKSSEGSEGDQRRVQEDKTGLSQKSVL